MRRRAERLELSVKLNGPQMLAHRVLFGDDGKVQRRRSILEAFGRGVGKTHHARTCWWLLIAAFDGKWRNEALQPFRGVRITSMAPTLKQWKDINWGGIEEELSPQGKWGFLGGRLDRQTGQVRFPGGSIVRPFPATVYNARTSRGLRTDVLDAEEFDDIDSEVYDGVAIPWLSEPWSLGIELLRGTPTRGRHGLWYRTLQTCKLAERVRSGTISAEDALKLPQAAAILSVFLELPANEWPEELPRDPELATLAVLKNYYSFHATYRDAPETVSALAVARAKATTPPATFSREWEADPDAGEGLVYSMFSEDFHVRAPPDITTFREFVVGMDHGTTDYGVLLLCGILGHGADAIVWVLEEIFESNCPNHIWDERAKKWSFAKFWPDTSRADRVADLRAMGLDVGETDRGPGSVKAGVARVADLLFIRSRQIGHMGEGVERYARLYVAPQCKHLIEEFGKYRYPKLPDGTFGDAPMDRWNHGQDSLRYLCLGRFGRPQTGRNVVSGR